MHGLGSQISLLPLLLFKCDCPKKTQGGRMPVLVTVLCVQEEQMNREVPDVVLPQDKFPTKVGALKKIVIYSLNKEPIADMTLTCQEMLLQSTRRSPE